MATVLKIAEPTVFDYWDYLVRVVLDDTREPLRGNVISRYSEIKEERRPLSYEAYEELIPCLRKSMDEYGISYEPWVGIHSQKDNWVDLCSHKAAVEEYEEITQGEEIWASIQKD